MFQYYELTPDQLRQAYQYYSFINWCIEEGWEPYNDGERIWINIGLPGKPIKHIKSVWFMYQKTLPQHIKDSV